MCVLYYSWRDDIYITEIRVLTTNSCLLLYIGSVHYLIHYSKNIFFLFSIIIQSFIYLLAEIEWNF